MGAMRTAIGDELKVDWRAFGSNPESYHLPDGQRLRDLIGFGDDYGPLTLAGPWPVFGGQRLYPVPLCLLEKSEGHSKNQYSAAGRPGDANFTGKGAAA